MPRISPASFRPNAGVSLVLGGSALGGFGYRYWTTKDDAEASGLDPDNFSAYTIAGRQPVSSTCSIFTLRARDAGQEARSLKEVWARAVWSVEVKQPQLQIARAYTPLPPTAPPPPPDGETDADDASELRFLIRREHGGEVSSYLHRLPAGATVELRGPHVEFEMPEEVKEVLFLAGGTGIAPALQVACALQQRPGARMRILWANRRREDCVGGKGEEAAGLGWRRWLGLGRAEHTAENEAAAAAEQGVMVRELEALKKRSGPGQQLAVEYFVDEEKSFMRPADVGRHLRSAERSDGVGSRLIMVSGPDGFLEHWAGRKVWAEKGEVQGPLRGVLSQLDLQDWRVWKL